MENTLQSRIFERIEARFEKKSQVADMLMDKLGIGRDAAYRRMRGETPLDPNELSLLAREFEISLDAIVFNQSDRVFFSFNSFPHAIHDVKEFMEEVYANVSEVYQMPGARYYYTTAELPVYHYCQFPELIQFKLYVWGRTVWNFEDLRHAKFSYDLIPHTDIGRIDDILELYYNIPSTDLWHLNIMDNTLNQIEYHVSSGGFSDPQIALDLCDKLLHLIDYVRTMAEVGHKFVIGQSAEQSKGAELELYYNEMIFTSNTILIISEQSKIVYTTYGSPNFLKCSNPRFGDHTEEWLRRIISKSISITTHEEKNRLRFFNKLGQKVERAKERIARLIELM